MDTMTTETTGTPVYRIVLTNDGFMVTLDGNPLRDQNGLVRYFRTRNSARKRIARERSGNFHR